MLSAGTRVDVYMDEDMKKWEKPGDTNYSGYVQCRLTGTPSNQLHQQGFVSPFDIEIDYITFLRPRATEVTANDRRKRRKGKERKQVVNS
jgi:hypothetical protein